MFTFFEISLNKKASKKLPHMVSLPPRSLLALIILIVLSMIFPELEFRMFLAECTFAWFLRNGFTKQFTSSEFK